MWVFGYGSLMWDGWENNLGCLRRLEADLPGYNRVFNKASIRNWGSKKHPGPTLNLERSENASCRGIAFEFPVDQEASVMTVLKDREGGFDLPELPATIPGGAVVGAITPIYTGKNIIVGKSLDEIVDMIAAASGTSGNCQDYARNVIAQIEALGVQDNAVAALSARLAKPAA